MSAQSTPSPSINPALRQCRAMTLACVLAMAALCLAWELWLAPLPGGRGALALKALPWCLAVPGVLKLRMYTYRWLSLMLWLYVAEGAVRVSTESGWNVPLAATELTLCAALFVLCVWHVRLRFRASASPR